MSDLKTCTKCKVEKQKTEFSKHKGRKDGFQSQCKLCIAAYKSANNCRLSVRRREYYAENSDRISAYMRVYRFENSERLIEYQREYNAKHSERKAEYTREYRAANPDSAIEYRSANPEKCAANRRNRRARVRMAEGSHTASDVKTIFESQRGLCANCKGKLFKSGDKKYHVDHIMPLAKGGSNDKYNLQCLCPACNLKKQAKDPVDWAKEHGKLI